MWDTGNRRVSYFRIDIDEGGGENIREGNGTEGIDHEWDDDVRDNVFRP